MKRHHFTALRFDDAIVVTDDINLLLSCCVRALDNDKVLKKSDKDAIFSDDRSRLFVDRRHVLMTLSLKYGAPRTIKEIGEMFNRTHATVLHARTKCANLIGSDRHLTKIFNSYEDQFKNAIK